MAGTTARDPVVSNSIGIKDVSAHFDAGCNLPGTLTDALVELDFCLRLVYGADFSIIIIMTQQLKFSFAAQKNGCQLSQMIVADIGW